MKSIVIALTVQIQMVGFISTFYHASRFIRIEEVNVLSFEIDRDSIDASLSIDGIIKGKQCPKVTIRCSR